jgi:hypothetical protein
MASIPEGCEVFTVAAPREDRRSGLKEQGTPWNVWPIGVQAATIRAEWNRERQSLRVPSVLSGREPSGLSDALVEHRKRREARVQQEAFTAAARDATRLANLRYTGGVSPYLEVLDSERQLFDSELGLVRNQRDEVLAVVRLYKALGGGWQP